MLVDYSCLGSPGQKLVGLGIPDVHVDAIDDPKEFVHVGRNRRVSTHFSCICWGHRCPHLHDSKHDLMLHRTMLNCPQLLMNTAVCYP